MMCSFLKNSQCHGISPTKSWHTFCGFLLRVWTKTNSLFILQLDYWCNKLYLLPVQISNSTIGQRELIQWRGTYLWMANGWTGSTFIFLSAHIPRITFQNPWALPNPGEVCIPGQQCHTVRRIWILILCDRLFCWSAGQNLRMKKTTLCTPFHFFTHRKAH